MNVRYQNFLFPYTSDMSFTSATCQPKWNCNARVSGMLLRCVRYTQGTTTLFHATHFFNTPNHTPRGQRSSSRWPIEPSKVMSTRSRTQGAQVKAMERQSSQRSQRELIGNLRCAIINCMLFLLSRKILGKVTNDYWSRYEEQKVNNGQGNTYMLKLGHPVYIHIDNLKSFLDMYFGNHITKFSCCTSHSLGVKFGKYLPIHPKVPYQKKSIIV